MSDEKNPPKWALRLLEFFLRPDYADEIQGDITEAYYWRMEEESPFKARFKFILEVFKSLKPTNLKSFYHLSLNTMIFRNYLKVAFRSLLKRKSTSFINIFGLSVGVATFIFIFLYTNQILTFDDHHENKDQIFMVYKERITPDGTQETYDTWVPMKDRLTESYEQIEASARIYNSEARIKKSNQYIEEDIIYTDASLFEVFTFPLLHGNPKDIFPNKNSIVLSVEMAKKYFDKENAIDEELEIFLPDEDTTFRFRVSAVIDNLPTNLTHQPDLMIEMEALPFYGDFANEWGNSFLDTYIMLKNGGDDAQLESAFPELVESIFGKETRENTNFKLLPMADFYDTFIGNKANARTLLWIGIGILFIAIVNFMNLSTAQASKRAKEIGLRKVLGAFQGQLRTQFITEAFVMSLFATIIGVGLVLLLIPSFNAFFDVSITLQIFSLSEIFMMVLTLAIALGLLSGSYPAFYLSSIGAIEVLRQRLGFGGTKFRNALVIVQFSIALFLIASTLIVRNQINYMTQKEMGFDSEGVLAIGASPSDFTDSEVGTNKINTFKTELASKSYVKEITKSRHVPTFWSGSFTFVRPDEWTGDPLRMRWTLMDANFFNVYGIAIKHGSNFLPDTEGDQRSSVILNEAAMKAFQFDPNEQNVVRVGETRLNVVGVVEDFHFETLQNEVAPTLMLHRTAESGAHRNISIKMDMSNLVERIEEIEAMWNELGSTREFTYAFMDDRMEVLYEDEERYLGMVTMFSVISIVVACLGLYGLTLFIIEKKRKEISIRKVLGAEVNTVLRLIFGEFTKWVAIAFIISVPIAIYFADDWLQSYYYRIEISWFTFGLALLIVLALVILTVGYQSLKAASANPVKYLKDE
ncbi:FtsX-like permease family protein [Ekhidna sp.]|uniref:FtsX-like permease family protein n=1 Tax=Ekhidna sp. TaxID=2608089 RepID=UPI0032EE0C83